MEAVPWLWFPQAAVSITPQLIQHWNKTVSLKKLSFIIPNCRQKRLASAVFIFSLSRCVKDAERSQIGPKELLRVKVDSQKEKKKKIGQGPAAVFYLMGEIISDWLCQPAVIKITTWRALPFLILPPLYIADENLKQEQGLFCLPTRGIKCFLRVCVVCVCSVCVSCVCVCPPVIKIRVYIHPFFPSLLKYSPPLTTTQEVMQIKITHNNKNTLSF